MFVQRSCILQLFLVAEVPFRADSPEFLVRTSMKSVDKDSFPLSLPVWVSLVPFYTSGLGKSLR